MPNIPISSLPLTTSVCANGLVPIVQNGVTFSTYSCLLGSGGSGGGSINCIIAGSGAAISPSSGIGNVTICSTTGGGGVDCVIAGSDISISCSCGCTTNPAITLNVVSGSLDSPMVAGNGCCSIVGNCSINNACGFYSFIGGGGGNFINVCGSFSFIGGGQSNTTNGAYSAIFGGFGNVTFGNNQGYITAFGCCLNACCQCTFYVNNLFACGDIIMPYNSSYPNLAGCVSNGRISTYAGNKSGVLINGENSSFSTVRCGLDNLTNTSCYSLVLGCNNNIDSGKFNFISGGTSNFINNKCYVSTLGLNVFCPSFDCTTYVNNLAINNLAGCSGLLCIGNNKKLEVIPTSYIITFQGGLCSVGRPSTNSISCGNYLGTYGVCSTSFDNNTSNFGICSNSNCGSSCSFIGGGFCHLICCSNSSFIGGGRSNCITLGSNNTILGGRNSCVVGSNNSIGAGTGACIFDGISNTIGGGGFICRGNYNFIGSSPLTFRNCILGCSYNTISSGYSNSMNSFGNGRSIGSGFCNRINSSNNSTIINGVRNTNCGDFSIIGGNTCATISGGARYNATLSGYRTSISGCYNFYEQANYSNAQSSTAFSTNIASGCFNTNSRYLLTLNIGSNTIISGDFVTMQQSFQFTGVSNSNYATQILAQSCCIENSPHSYSNGTQNRILNSSNSSILKGQSSCIINSENSFLNGFINQISASPYSGAIGCCISNNVPCSFMSNQLIACNIFGAASICADANGIISPVVSDLRIKKNINPLEYGLKELKELNPVSYKWDDAHKEINGLSRKIGFIAQEVGKIIPEAVSSQNDKYIFDDKAILPVIVKSIQQISSRISILNAKIDAAMCK